MARSFEDVLAGLEPPGQDFGAILAGLKPPVRDPTEEARFRTWYAARAKRLNLDPNPDDPRHHYDYRAAFRAGAEPDPETGHWPSEFKADDHPNRYVGILDTKTGRPREIPGGLPAYDEPAPSPQAGGLRGLLLASPEELAARRAGGKRAVAALGDAVASIADLPALAGKAMFASSLPGGVEEPSLQELRTLTQPGVVGQARRAVSAFDERASQEQLDAEIRAGHSPLRAAAAEYGSALAGNLAAAVLPADLGAAKLVRGVAGAARGARAGEEVAAPALQALERRGNAELRTAVDEALARLRELKPSPVDLADLQAKAVEVGDRATEIATERFAHDLGSGHFAPPPGRPSLDEVVGSASTETAGQRTLRKVLGEGAAEKVPQRASGRAGEAIQDPPPPSSLPPPLRRPSGEEGSVSTGPLTSARDWVVENFRGGGPQAGKYALAAREFPAGPAREVVRSIPGRIEKMEGRAAVPMAHVNDLIDDATPLVRRIAPSGAGQKALWEDLQAVAEGSKPIETIPEPLRPLIARRQDLVEALQKRGVDTGAFPDDMVEALSGTYKHRTYRAFKDPKHYEKVFEAPDWYAAKDYLAKEMPKASEGEVLDVLTAITKRPKGAEGLAVQQAPTRLNAILRERQNIPPPLRKIMGEERDFRIALTDTVGQLAQDIEAHNFWKSLGEDGLAAGVFRDPKVPAPAGYEGGLWRPIPGSNKVEGISSRGPVEGLLTRETLRDAIVGQFEPVPSGVGARIAAMVNLGKTVGSVPAGHIRNFVAHHVTSAANGKSPALLYQRLGEVVRLFKDPAMRGMRDRMIELGITNEGASSREIFDFIQTLEEGGPLARGAAKMGRALGKSWRAGDDLWRTAHWLDEVDQLAWANPEMSRPAIEEWAANRVKDTFQTYSRAPEFARKLRRTPFGGPGVTFHAESARNLKNIARTAAQDLAAGIRQGNPRMVVLGMRRAAGLIAVPAAVASLPAAGRLLSGANKEVEAAARRRLVPSYHENAEMLLTRFEPGKELAYLDVSFLDPYSATQRAGIAAYRSMTEGAPAPTAIAEFLDQVSGGDIATKEFLQLALNHRMGSIWPPELQGPIANFDEEPAPWKGLGQLAYHGYRGLAPGGIVQGENLLHGAGALPQTTETGRKFSLPQEILGTFGVRVTTQKIPDRLRSGLGELAEHVAALRPRPPVDPAELPAKADLYLTAWEKKYHDLELLLKDFRSLGMEGKDMRSLVIQSRLPPAMAKAALAGLPNPPSPVQFDARGGLSPYWSTPERQPLALAIVRRWRERYLGKEQ